MYAIIIDGCVAEVTETLPAPGTLFVECGPQVQVGWVLRGGALAAPPAPDPRAAILAELAALDVFVPRSVEEMYAAASVKGLAEINVARITRKVELRAQLAALGG